MHLPHTETSQICSAFHVTIIHLPVVLESPLVNHLNTRSSSGIGPFIDSVIYDVLSNPKPES